jgi:hypothetical protein
MYVCMYVCICMCMHLYVFVCMYVCVCIYVLCKCINLYVCIQLCMHICQYLYRICLQCLIPGFYDTNRWNIVYTNVCLQIVFEIQLKTCWFQSFRFLSVETLKNPSIFSSNWKWRDTTPMYLSCLPDHLQLHRETRNCLTVLIRCVYVFIDSCRRRFKHFLWIVT